jgi:hypothetical protein
MKRWVAGLIVSATKGGRLLMDIKGEFSWTKTFFDIYEKSYTIIKQ